MVHVWSSYPSTSLELKDYGRSGEWRCACLAPCDQSLIVLGADARVSAPGMTTSNVFRIEPGPSVAVVRVEGGASLSRTLGIAGLAAGIPLGLAGTAMWSYGRYSDDDGLSIGGAVVLGTGAVAILASLPLLLAGGTDVLDARGKVIARDDGRAGWVRQTY